MPPSPFTHVFHSNIMKEVGFPP